MAFKKKTIMITFVSTIVCFVLIIVNRTIVKDSIVHNTITQDEVKDSTNVPKEILSSWRATDIYPNNNTIISLTDESFTIEFYYFKRTFGRFFRKRESNATNFTCGGVDACNYFNADCNIGKDIKTLYNGGVTNSIRFSTIAKTKKGCSYPGRPFAPHVSMTDMLSNVKSFVVTDTTLVLYTDDNQYLFDKEIKGTLMKTQIPIDTGMSIKLNNGDILQLPALQEELESQYEMYNRTVYMTQIVRMTDMASIYPGTIVSVKTIRFEPSMVFGRPLRAFVEEPGSSIQKPALQTKHVLPRLIVSHHTNWNYDLSPSILSEISSIRDKTIFIQHWCHAAQHECSSIKSFEQIILELEHYGAPEWIVIKAHKARFDEIKHTRMTLSLANAAQSFIDHIQYDLEPISTTLLIRPVEQLIRENYQDACVGEKKASEQLSKQATALTRNSKPNLAALLDIMSADEATHAQLGHCIDTFLKTL